MSAHAPTGSGPETVDVRRTVGDLDPEGAVAAVLAAGRLA